MVRKKEHGILHFRISEKSHFAMSSALEPLFTTFISQMCKDNNVEKRKCELNFYTFTELPNQL